MKEIIDSFNLICRLCLENPKKLLNIFDEKNDFQKKLFDLTEIQANELDQLPSNVCLKCFKKIEQFFKFKTECSEAEFLLKEKLEELKNKIPEIKLIKKSERIRKLNDVGVELLIKKEHEDFLNSDSEICDGEEEEERLLIDEDFGLIVDVDVQIKNEDSNEILDEIPKVLENLNKNKKIKQKKKIYPKPESPCHICGKLIERCKLEYHINQHNGEWTIFYGDYNV